MGKEGLKVCLGGNEPRISRAENAEALKREGEEESGCLGGDQTGGAKMEINQLSEIEITLLSWHRSLAVSTDDRTCSPVIRAYYYFESLYNRLALVRPSTSKSFVISSRNNLFARHSFNLFVATGG